MYDAAVIGLGGMGSATAAWSARRGLRTIGFEQHDAVHTLGASQGKTRLIRMAYFEGPEYVPLLRRAFELWRELEGWSAKRLFDQAGAIFTGTPQTNVIRGTLASAGRFDLNVERMGPGALRERFPFLRPREDETGVYEPTAGAVFPETTVAACIDVARAAGAELHFRTPVARWESVAGGARIHLTSGRTVEARRLAICAGSWFSQVLRDLHIPIRIERNVQAWFDPADRAALTQHFPAFALERDGRFFYGFPDYGDGIKCAFHHSGSFARSPQELDREIHDADVAPLRDWLQRFIPAAAGTFRGASVCTYALTPDEHFILGAHPDAANVYIAGGFSGHGFKFVPVIGEIMADYLEKTQTPHPVTMFSPGRFLG